MSTNGVSPHYATTTDDEAFGELETALRRQIKDALDGVTTSYDKLDDRIQIVEQRLPKNLRFRLKTLEDHARSQEAANNTRPNSAAAAAALEERVDAIVTSNLSALQSTVDQHKQLFEDKVNAIVTSKLSALQSQVDQHKYSLELLSKSTTTAAQSSESMPEKEQNEDDPLSTYSHDELARELLHRLEGGQTLSLALVARIRLAIELPPPPSSNSENPKSAARSRKRLASPSPSNLSSIADEEPAAKKRFQSAPAPTPARTRASSRKLSSMWKTRKPAAADDDEGPMKPPFSDKGLTAEELELLLLQDEPRRSGRASKPARNPQFMTWLEVAAAKRRTSSG